MPIPQLLVKQKWATAGSCVVFYGYLLSINNSLQSHQSGKISARRDRRRDFLCWTSKTTVRSIPLLTALQSHCGAVEKDPALLNMKENFLSTLTRVHPLVGSDLTREIYHNLWLSPVCPWKWNANNAIKNNMESACDNVHNDYGILDPHNFRCHCTERACIDFCGLM